LRVLCPHLRPPPTPLQAEDAIDALNDRQGSLQKAITSIAATLAAFTNQTATGGGATLTGAATDASIALLQLQIEAARRAYRLAKLEVVRLEAAAVEAQNDLTAAQQALARSTATLTGLQTQVNTAQAVAAAALTRLRPLQAPVDEAMARLAGANGALAAALAQRDAARLGLQRAQANVTTTQNAVLTAQQAAAEAAQQLATVRIDLAGQQAVLTWAMEAKAAVDAAVAAAKADLDAVMASKEVSIEQLDAILEAEVKLANVTEDSRTTNALLVVAQQAVEAGQSAESAAAALAAAAQTRVDEAVAAAAAAAAAVAPAEAALVAAEAAIAPLQAAVAGADANVTTAATVAMPLQQAYNDTLVRLNVAKAALANRTAVVTRLQGEADAALEAKREAVIAAQKQQQLVDDYDAQIVELNRQIGFYSNFLLSLGNETGLLTGQAAQSVNLANNSSSNLTVFQQYLNDLKPLLGKAEVKAQTQFAAYEAAEKALGAMALQFNQANTAYLTKVRGTGAPRGPPQRRWLLHQGCCTRRAVKPLHPSASTCITSLRRQPPPPPCSDTLAAGPPCAGARPEGPGGRLGHRQGRLRSR